VPVDSWWSRGKAGGMKIDAQASEHAYRTGLAVHAGEARRWFESLVAVCLRRFLLQEGGEIPAPETVADFGRRLWVAASAVGWPSPLVAGSTCGPEERSWDGLEAHVSAIAASGNDETERARLLPVARQLLKTCIYGEFTDCRNSFRQIAADNRCRRQDPAIARARISGTPCVDCPYYVTLAQEEHARLLEASWATGNPVPYAREPALFLPEDFRELRRFLWMQARFGHR